MSMKVELCRFIAMPRSLLISTRRASVGCGRLTALWSEPRRPSSDPPGTTGPATLSKSCQFYGREQLGGEFLGTRAIGWRVSSQLGNSKSEAPNVREDEGNLGRCSVRRLSAQ